MKEKKWIKERKSVLLKEIVRQMLLAKLFFDGIYENYQKSGQVSFQELEHWIGTEINKGSLWNLKDTSHLLFRDNATKSFFYERVFDWTLRSIFHEGMKLKEDVYLTEVYQKEGKVFTNGANIPEDVNIQGLLEEYETIITSAKESAAEEMENLRYLFSKGVEQLQRLIIYFKDNVLLIRFLVENQEVYNRVYGKGALKKLFEIMYERGLEEAYLQVGKSYREGGWYNEALEMFKKAREINPHNEEIEREWEQTQQTMASLE